MLPAQREGAMRTPRGFAVGCSAPNATWPPQRGPQEASAARCNALGGGAGASVSRRLLCANPS
eukprot:11204463-Lingulodinium_polyedra.AAC.1